MSTTPPEPPTSGSHYQPSLGVVIVILVVFVVGAFFMLRSTKAGRPVAGATTTTVAPSGPTSHGSTTTTVVVKSKVRVQVANGTTVTGLARNFTQQLLTYGWDTLPQANGPHVSSTVIYYNPGFQSAARMIAAELKFPASAVTSLNGANPVSGAASDDVIVLLGLNAAVTGG